MKIRAIFENGNAQYVTGVVRSDGGELIDAKTSYYSKEIECDVKELQGKFPSVEFKVERRGC